MNKLTVAALALVSMALASTAASAQVVVNAGDLILGFEIASGNNASPTDLEVDLGPVSQFTTTATINLSSKLSVSDLTSTFGASWASNTAGTGVSWGAIGNNGTGANLDLTSEVTPPGLSTNGLKGYASDVQSLTTGSGGINGSPAASTSTSALIGNSVTPANGIANSWTSIIDGKVLGEFGRLEGVGATNDELYSDIGGGFSGTVTDLGTLSLSPTGALTFTGSAAAVPEPSAYALGICAVLLFIVLRRRHTVA